MEKIEFNDIQGLLVRGYGELLVSSFHLLHIDESNSAKEWLKLILDQVTAASKKPGEHAFQIAFTHEGLKALGMDEESLGSFSREFKEGMTTDHRQRILGDTGDSEPSKWQWGGSGSGSLSVHIVLMMYGKDHETLRERNLFHVNSFGRYGIRQIIQLDSSPTETQARKEPFGFHDGISQPLIEGLTKKGDPDNTLKPGEFILGYRNEYQFLPESPYVPRNARNAEFLPEVPLESSQSDFGKNGSYMVFRQLHQDVLKFWNFLEGESKKGTAPNRVALGAKMIGRWPSGCPVVTSPDADNTEFGDENNFEFAVSDPHGYKCPVGSHIRRSNPRNALTSDPVESIDAVKKHRILRRGRPYGTQIESNNPEIIKNDPTVTEDRGIYFICFNSNINRQFEFVQDTWINNAKFHSLYDEPDPLVGDPNHSTEQGQNTFTIQSGPIRKRIVGIPQFVTVTGGAYFFMPGIKALHYLSQMK